MQNGGVRCLRCGTAALGCGCRCRQSQICSV